MADFKIALKPTLHNEGGYVKDPNDSGGETYRGISRHNFPHWSGWSMVDAAKPLHTGQLISNTQLDELIAEFYQLSFWNPIRGNEIINQDVANDLFDKSVNMGYHQAVVLSQRSLGIAESGKMDDVTLSTLNQMNPYA